MRLQGIAACLVAITSWCSLTARAQQSTGSSHTYVVSSQVGEVIDHQEKVRFGLFPYYAADDFKEARFLQYFSADSSSNSVVLQATMRSGELKTRRFTESELQDVRRQIEGRSQELQQYGARNAVAGDSIGGTYSVELRSGTSFVGVLLARNDNELEFDAQDIGRVSIQKSNIRSMQLLSETQLRKGWEPVGNGTRMFFAPTARNLRRGEGYVQDINIVLLGANYGITDHISIGALVPALPGVGLNVFAITPKVSVPISEKFHVGGGLLYAFAFGSGGGIAYGVGTYGTADNNATLGLGYLVGSGDVDASPVVLVGGATRISRRFSLLNETYITDGFLAGLVGARVSAARVSGSLGFIYGTGIPILPAYLEVAYRFGRVR
ncbi:hypothetical protein [Hymenobacter defluvii]|uniref:hypothetical protein n=1 Tax=Hymenobacter defluvii TaxID=2054411 RepID=UPI001AAE4873|nr:hypothetical protein [Hymenobacter defluvii]